jgi:hypothetical protein
MRGHAPLHGNSANIEAGYGNRNVQTEAASGAATGRRDIG